MLVCTIPGVIVLSNGPNHELAVELWESQQQGIYGGIAKNNMRGNELE